jgi:hypothetical protein
VTAERICATFTYVHFWRHAESIIAPDAPSFFPLKSASVMEVSMVTAPLVRASLLKMKVDNALLFRRSIRLGY